VDWLLANYNTLITQLKFKLVAQPIVTYTTSKQQLTCLNCGKMVHAKETCDNKKREELAVLVVPTKVAKLVTKVIAQPVKLARMPLRYPCIIYYNLEHHVPNCPRKIKVQNIL
jgi:hypothetical protein